MKRESWHSRLGFAVAAMGSAIGLANIWRFPYIVGQYGGAAFIIVYLLCLVFIGLPVFMAEIVIGRAAKQNPSGAFIAWGKNRFWRFSGHLIVITGFLVSSFYSVVAGWILGYFIFSVGGKLSVITNSEIASHFFANFLKNPYGLVSWHFLFMLICALILIRGVKKGIEKANKILLPALFFILIGLVIRGMTLPRGLAGFHFLLSARWAELTPTAILIALGHAFFTLSLGQGTMITYGSYLKGEENLPKLCLPVLLADTFVSILAGVAIFTTAFSTEVPPQVGFGLVFQTLPLIFEQIPGGQILLAFFFFFVLIAAISSQISAMEPTIAYLIDHKKKTRKNATFIVAICAFLIGIPCALSFNVFSGVGGKAAVFDCFNFLTTSILIPMGGLLSVILVGWVQKKFLFSEEFKRGDLFFFKKYPWIEKYFYFCIKYVAPLLIIIVFIHILLS